MFSVTSRVERGTSIMSLTWYRRYKKQNHFPETMKPDRRVSHLPVSYIPPFRVASLDLISTLVINLKIFLSPVL